MKEAPATTRKRSRPTLSRLGGGDGKRKDLSRLIIQILHQRDSAALTRPRHVSVTEFRPPPAGPSFRRSSIGQTAQKSSPGQTRCARSGRFFLPRLCGSGDAGLLLSIRRFKAHITIEARSVTGVHLEDPATVLVEFTLDRNIVFDTTTNPARFSRCFVSPLNPSAHIVQYEHPRPMLCTRIRSSRAPNISESLTSDPSCARSV